MDQVQVTGADREAVDSRKAVGGVEQDRLHLVGGEARVLLEKVGDRTRDDGCRHAASGELDPVFSDDQVGVQAAQGRSGCESRDDLVPRRDEVGLQDVVAVRRSLAAVSRGDVVAAVGGVAVVHRADREDVGIVTGAVDREVPVAAAVAGRHDDHEPCAPRALDGLRQRVGVVGLGRRVAERQVEDADSVRVLVGDRPIDRVDDAAHVALTVRIQNAERDQAGAGRNALHGTAHAGPSDDAGDVRPVAERVGARARAREVHTREDAGGRDGVTWREAGVDDGDRHVLTRVAHVAREAIGADGRNRGVHRRGHAAIGGDAEDAGVSLEIFDVAARQRRGDRGGAAEPAGHPAALPHQRQNARIVQAGGISNDDALFVRQRHRRPKVRSDLVQTLAGKGEGRNHRDDRYQTHSKDSSHRVHWLYPPVHLRPMRWLLRRTATGGPDAAPRSDSTP